MSYCAPYTGPGEEYFLEYHRRTYIYIYIYVYYVEQLLLQGQRIIAKGKTTRQDRTPPQPLEIGRINPFHLL